MTIPRRNFLAGATALGLSGVGQARAAATPKVDLILHNGKITTGDSQLGDVEAIAISDGTIVQCGSDATLLGSFPATRRIDLNGRRVIPGLNDSHLHVIRGGLYYNLELRWDGVPTIAQQNALESAPKVSSM